MQYRRMLLIGFLSLTSASAKADGVDLNTVGGLLDACKNVEVVSRGHGDQVTPTNMAFLCSGYLAGMMNAMNFYSTVLGMRAICIPPDVDVKQVTAIFMKWAESRPEDWHRAASNGVFDALGEHYMCRKK